MEWQSKVYWASVVIMSYCYNGLVVSASLIFSARHITTIYLCTARYWHNSMGCPCVCII